MTAVLDPDEFATFVASFGVAGTGHAPASSPIDQSDWPRTLAAVRGYRLTGLAHAAAGAGWISLTDHQMDQLGAAHRDAMVHALVLERELMTLADAFDRASIDVVVLKGPAMAHGWYPDPSWRCFGDLDLLVRAGDWRRACALLAAHGYVRKLPEPRPAFDERFGKAATHEHPDGTQIDLHRTLAAGPFAAWIEPDLLFQTAGTFTMGGRTFARLGDSEMLLHACIHAVIGNRPPLPGAVRDVAQLLFAGGVDWDRVAALAARWRLRAVVARALRSAADAFRSDLPVGARALLDAPAGREELRALAAFDARERDRRVAREALRAITRPADKVAYAISLLFPTREFIGAREPGTPSYLRRWARALRGSRAGSRMERR